MYLCWGNLKQTTLERGWNKIFKPTSDIPLGGEDTTEQTAENLSNLAQAMEGGEDVDAGDILDWFECDRDAPEFACLNMEEIAKQLQNDDSGDSDEEEELSTKVSLDKASESISELIQFFHYKDIPATDKVVLFKLRSYIRKCESSVKRQTFINDYFTKNTCI